MPSPSYAVILPVRNEAACLPRVLSELQPLLADLPVTLVAAVNGCTDDSVDILRANGVVTVDSPCVGYGAACLAALRHLREHQPDLRGYLFLAADGANDPRDLPNLFAAHRDGADLVLGQRTTCVGNWSALGPVQILGNLLLGGWVGLLTGRPFADLGPMRLIDADLLDRLPMQEPRHGWTIEMQVLAQRVGARIETLTVCERRRLAGLQKISGVSLRQSATIAWEIACAGWRARRRSFAEHATTLATPTLTQTP